MIYRYDRKHNKNMTPMFLLAIGAVVAGGCTFLFANTVVALLCTGVGLYVAYTIFKTADKILSSRVNTYTEGLTVYTTTGEKLQFDYAAVNYAGVVTNGEHPGLIFVYREDQDRIATIPPMFENFDDLVAEIKENTPFKEYTLEEDEKTIVDHLKKILKPADDEPVDAPEAPEAPADN